MTNKYIPTYKDAEPSTPLPRNAKADRRDKEGLELEPTFAFVTDAMKRLEASSKTGSVPMALLDSGARFNGDNNGARGFVPIYEERRLPAKKGDVDSGSLLQDYVRPIVDELDRQTGHTPSANEDQGGPILRVLYLTEQGQLAWWDPRIGA